MLLRVISSLLLLTWLLPGQTVENFRAKIRGLQFDPQQCYRVRDLMLEREDVKFYFTDGLLIFAQPIDGRDVGAFFIAQEATDSAEILAIPPTAQERYSMASFTGDGVLNRPFNHALFLFTDDTADALRAGLQTSSRANADPAQGAVLGQRWSPVLKNLLENASVRIATDLLAGLPKTDGFVAAALGTGATRFDMIIDPREPGDQVSIGQSVRKDGMVYQEVWSRFPARTFRNGSRKRVGFGARIDTYDLDVSLDDDLEIDVTASAKLTVTEPGRTAFPFGLSGRLQVTEITVNGTAAEFLHEKRAGPSSEFNYSTALLVLPEAPEPGTLLDVRFRYQGSVVEHTTNDVYLVGSRTSWYPRGEFEPSNYRLTFHYPANLDLRATGVLRETTTEGERRTSLYETEQPIRLAGFNLGRYVSEVREVGGYRLEILANRELESRFQPREQIIATPPPPTNPRRSPMNTARQTVVRISSEATPTPVEPIGKIADAVKSSFEYFLSHLGPPVSQAVSVTPVPNGYGQGFPGLVYAPTLSYLHVDRPPMTGLTESQRAFYKESLFPHEISHQWWGNRVIVDDLSDTWLVEALATYSALLYLEEKSGPGTIGRFLNYYLTDLQQENQEGEATESAGPIVLGDRLTSSRFPNAMATIVYGKGAWILHMIRTAIGPESFAKLLAGLATEFAQRPLSTDDFREAAAAYLPAESRDPEFKEFFDQWVYGTGMPRLTVRWSQKQGRVTGEIEQEDVPDYFAVPVTLEFQTEGEAIRKIVHTDGSATEFSFTIPQKVQSVRLDPDRSLLALIEQP